MHEQTVNEDLLTQFTGTPVWRLYEPPEVYAVLGASGNPRQDLILERLGEDGVPFQFRRGGGGTVVLSPGQVVLALVAEVSSPYRNREYAQEINCWFMAALGNLGVRGVEHRGISDLALAERKILGTSVYRRRLVLFYQASLLVCNDLSLFDRYLAMPVRVPDYRRGRGHRDFCTTLRQSGYDISVGCVLAELGKVVEQRISGLASSTGSARCSGPP